MSDVVLVTGGSGFFGGILKRVLLEKGFFCLSVDLEHDEGSHGNLISVQGDISDITIMEDIFCSQKITVVFHCAAMLAHDAKDKNTLWRSNVEGTANIAEMCKKYGTGKVIYISSNCLWAKDFGRKVTEND